MSYIYPLYLVVSYELSSLGGGYYISIKVFFSGVCGFGKNKRRQIGHSRLNRKGRFYTVKNAHSNYDLETQPYDLAENLHVAPNQ